MESNEESTVGADHLHILLADRLTLLLTQDRIYVTRMSHICECWLHISYVAYMNADCAENAENAEKTENADCDPLTTSPTDATIPKCSHRPPLNSCQEEQF